MRRSGPSVRLRIVTSIARKELVESLRDRRTLFMMIAVPMLLYPALLLIVTQVAALQQEKLEEQVSHVGVRLGADEAARRGDSPVTAHPLVTHLSQQKMIELHPLPPAEHRIQIEESQSEESQSEESQSEESRIDASERVVAAGDEDLEALGASTDVQLDAVLTLGEWPEDARDARTGRVAVHFESVEDRSRLARDRLVGILDAWETSTLQARVQAHNLPPSLADPVELALDDRSDEAERGGFLLGSIVPMLVVLTVLLGAFYPAIDLTAGEKERGSIQTLFTAPVTLLEIVVGKYAAVVCIALVSGAANLVSMGLMFGTVGRRMFGDAVDISLPLDVGVIGVLLATVVMIATFFGALVLAIAVLARDFKDAQNLLTPIVILAMVPGMIAQLPGFELTRTLAMVPGVNVILLMKQVLVEGVDLESVFLVAVSSLAATALALVFAARLFGQERILVGERGSFDLFARPSEIRPKSRPSVGEAVAWVVVSFVLLFYLGVALQQRSLMYGLIATLWGVLLIPTLAVARYLKLDLRETFALRWPGWRPIVAAGIMGLTTWALVHWLNGFVEYVLPPPDEFVEGMKRLFEQPHTTSGWLLTLFAAAVSPAVCEEMLFRGWLFSGLKGRVSRVALLVLTSLAFALFHLSIYRIVGPFLLGFVMGVLVLHSRSIFPAMLFHALNNTTALGLGGQRWGWACSWWAGRGATLAPARRRARSERAVRLWAGSFASAPRPGLLLRRARSELGCGWFWERVGGQP